MWPEPKRLLGNDAAEPFPIEPPFEGCSETSTSSTMQLKLGSDDVLRSSGIDESEEAKIEEREGDEGYRESKLELEADEEVTGSRGINVSSSSSARSSPSSASPSSTAFESHR